MEPCSGFDPFNHPWDNIDDLTIDEIDSLMPQLASALEEAKLKEQQLKEQRHISEVVEEKFAKVWGDVENELTEEFKRETLKEKEDFVFIEGFRVVMSRVLDEDHLNLFLKVVKQCVKNKNFKENKKFYQRVDSPELREVGKVGFAVYRLNLSKKVNESYVGGDWIRGKIYRLRKSESPLVKLALEQFTEIGLLPN